MTEWWQTSLELAAVEAEVRRVETRYCRAFDNRDKDAIRSVYASDARFGRPGHESLGIEAILELCRGLWAAETHPTRHFPTVFEVEAEGDRWRARIAYFVVIGQGRDLHVGWGDYDDLLRRDGNRLVIESKTSTLEGLMAVPGGWEEASQIVTPWTIPGGER